MLSTLRLSVCPPLSANLLTANCYSWLRKSHGSFNFGQRSGRWLLLVIPWYARAESSHAMGIGAWFSYTSELSWRSLLGQQSDYSGGFTSGHSSNSSLSSPMLCQSHEYLCVNSLTSSFASAESWNQVIDYHLLLVCYGMVTCSGVNLGGQTLRWRFRVMNLWILGKFLKRARPSWVES